MGSPLSQKEVAAVRWYVKECTRNIMRNREGCAVNDRTVEERIQHILAKQVPLTSPLILWRGHVKTPALIDPSTWFSTSTSQKAAKNLFTNSSGCCLFKIHVMPGIRVLDVGATLKSPTRKRSPTRKSPRSPTTPTRSNRSNNALKSVLAEELEVIVEGGGVFHKDVAGTKKGFHEHDGIYETYYYPRGVIKSPKKLTSAELVDLVEPNYYDFIKEADDFDAMQFIPQGYTASPAVRDSAAKRIRALAGDEN